MGQVGIRTIDEALKMYYPVNSSIRRCNVPCKISAFQLLCRAGTDDPFISYGIGPSSDVDDVDVVVFQTEDVDAEYEGEFNEQRVHGLVRDAFRAGVEWARKNPRSHTEENREKLRETLDKLDDICEGHRDAFVAFVKRGEDMNNFVTHLVGCEKCKAAVEKIFEKTKEAFERLARDLHQ